MKIILASNNKNKIFELKQILSPLGYEIISQSEAGVNIEVEEEVDADEAREDIKKAKELGKKFEHSMTSNGFRLTKDVKSELKKKKFF